MVNILCYSSKTLVNGENPLVIRVCKDGKKKYQSLRISGNPKYWDFEKEFPKMTNNPQLIAKQLLENYGLDDIIDISMPDFVSV